MTSYSSILYDDWFMSWHRCPNIAYLDVSETRVTSSGVTLFLACHQNVVCIDHEETFHILALVRIALCSELSYSYMQLLKIHDHFQRL